MTICIIRSVLFLLLLHTVLRYIIRLLITHFFVVPIYIIGAQHIPPHLFSSSWSFAVLRVLDVGMLVVFFVRNIPINDRRAELYVYQTMFIYLLFYLLHGGSRERYFLEIRRSSPMAMLDRESPRVLRRSLCREVFSKYAM